MHSSTGIGAISYIHDEIVCAVEQS
jgi:hypothetical protein